MTLEKLTPVLMQIPAEDVRVPNLPIATALQEAHDLLRFAKEPKVRGALVAVGMVADFTDQFAERIDVAREAQSAWVAERDRNKSQELVEAEAQAAETRSRMIAAGRHNLKSDAEAQSALSAIAGGEGVADLVQDLHDLAELFERRVSAFERDQSFDVEQEVAAARELAKLLSAHVSEERLTPPNTARDLRDRAFSYLYELVSEVRSAGRYAFRSDTETRKRFSSRYRRRINRRRSKSSDTAQPNTPTEEIVEEEFVQE